MVDSVKFARWTRKALIPLFIGALALAAVSRATAQTDGAGSIDAASMEALMQTMQLMQDPAQREAYIKEQGGSAKVADDRLSRFVRTEEQKQAIYMMAAQIFQQLVKEHQGDPEALKKAVQSGMRNPEVFFQNLTPEQRAQIQSLSKQVGNPPTPSSP